MAKAANQILTDLKNGSYAPIYFLQGEEPYYIDLISDFIEENALEESEKGFNQRVVYGKDIALNDIISAAKAFPMMGQRQVIIVKEAQELSELKKKEDATASLEAYLQNPQPSTVLVLAHKHKKLDKRKKLYKLIDKHAVLVESSKIYENKVPEWIQSYIQEKGHKINRQATVLLTEYIGNNLERLSNELNKILINFTEPVTIDEALVEEYVGINKDYNVFELQKAIATADVLKANRIINYFAKDPKSNPVILTIGFLHSYFTKLLKIHAKADFNEKAVAASAGVSPFFAKEYIMAVRRYNLGKVIQNLDFIHQADLVSKGISGSISEDQLLKELVYKLMH